MAGSNGKAKGINEHPIFKLGKRPAKQDDRNLMFAAVLRKPAPAAAKLPAKYDFDTKHHGIPTPMFGNDTYGCCVISGRAHQTLRFENIEQKSVLTITDVDVTKEYFKETGGPDSGLYVLDSLNLWRQKGWKAAKHTYKIKAFAQIDFTDHHEVKAAIYADVGIGIGVSLPTDASDQFQTGQPWDVTSGSGSVKGSWGGHYVYCCGYTPQGPVCVTWSRKQQMTWAWLDKYCDEAYAIFDAKNRFKKTMIDLPKIEHFLAALEPEPAMA